MTKIVTSLFAAAAIFAASTCAAQGVRFGVKVGATVSHMHSDSADYESSESATGIVAGPFAELSLSRAMTFQPALVFARHGGTFRNLSASLTGSLQAVDELNLQRDYLEAQALFRYCGPWRDSLPLSLIAGPAIGWVLDYEVLEDGTPIDERFNEDGAALSRSSSGYDLALLAGAGFQHVLWGRQCSLDLVYRLASDGPSGKAVGSSFKADGLNVTFGVRF